MIFWRKIVRFPLVFVVLGYLAINIWFNYRFYWHELLFDTSKIGATVGEIQASEWGLEKIYQKIIHFKNPFSPIQELLYPFGIDIVAADPGLAFYFPIFRPFFSTHQSLMLVIVMGLFLANIGMYALLRRLGMSRPISFVIGLSYGYMTFLIPRIGHPIYVASVFLFPWFFLFAVIFFQSKDYKIKLLASFGASFFFVMTLWQNVYFFIILLLSCLFLFLYWFFFQRKTFFLVFKKNWLYVFFICGVLLIFLYPWLKALYESFLFSEIPRPTGWGGAVEFSSDLFGFFIPSIYNYYYGPLIIYLIRDIEFAKNVFENFTYPGIIILLSYFFLFLFYRKFPQKFKATIKPYVFTSFAFLILTLGPFLHIAGRWFIELDDGIRLVMPLPYILLHYVPFLGNIRVPGRLIVGFIFFAYVVSAYLLSFYLKNKSDRFKIFFIVLLVAIVIVDHRSSDIPIIREQFFPETIYQIVKKDPQVSSVLEVPFTVRDGFTYLGDYNSIGMTIGQAKHTKPVLGGYSGRIPDYIKNYYRQNPFLGYLARVIDEDLQTNPFVDKNDLVNWQNIDILKSQRTIDFLDLKYIILNEKKPYRRGLSEVFQNLGFEKKKNDGHFSLWQRDPVPSEFLEVKVGNPDDELFLGLGWYQKEEDFRWANKKNSVLFKVTKPRKFTLKFQASSFYKDQQVTIYLNKKEVASLIVDQERKTYTVPVNKTFKKGINFVYFIFKNAYIPKEVIPNSLDGRRLTAKFFSISLTD